jgi:hypothetical protein
MKIAPALLLALASLGCANEITTAPPNHAGGGGDKLPAAALLGPFATVDAACSAALGKAGGPAAACQVTPIAAPDAPFQIRLLRAENGGDPRFVGSGTYLLAVGKDGAWFALPEALDHVEGAAGHSRLPAIAPTKVSVTKKPTLLVLTQMHDAITQMCNSCEGAARTERKPVDARTLIVVCSEKAGRPVCAAPVTAADKAQVGLDEGTLSVGVPGGPVKRYEVGF